MAESSKHLEENAFTKAGWERLGDIAVNCLKRGKNGAGYETGVKFDSDLLPDTTLTQEQVDTIRCAVVSGSTPKLIVNGVGMVVEQAYYDLRNAKPD